MADPQDVVVELSVGVLEELSGHRKLHQLRYPTFIVLTHPNFQVRSIEGLQAVKGTALKEVSRCETTPDQVRLLMAGERARPVYTWIK